MEMDIQFVRMAKCYNSLIKKWDAQYKVDLACVVVSFREDRVFGGFKRIRDLMKEAKLSVTGGKECVPLARKKREALIKQHCRQEKCRNLIQMEDIEDLNVSCNKGCLVLTDLVKELIYRKLVTRDMALDNCVNRVKFVEELDGQDVIWDDSLTDADLSNIFLNEGQDVSVERERCDSAVVVDLRRELVEARRDVELLRKVEEDNVSLRKKTDQQQRRIVELENQLKQLMMVKGGEFCVESDAVIREMLKDKFILKKETAEEAMKKLDLAMMEYKKTFMDGFLFNQVFSDYNEWTGKELWCVGREEG